MSKTPDDEGDLVQSHGVVLRAKNGDVIRYDPSGLVLKLSDKVVQDLALRLPQPVPNDAPDEDVESPEGVDAWDTRRQGDWLHFTARLPGSQGVRAFRRHVDGGDIIANAHGPVLGILGLGGARAALANPRRSDFPYHILAPADDIGAVGHAGVELAAATNEVEHLREVTHEALVAETILHWRLADYGPMPLFLTRVETDAALTTHDLAQGIAVRNLLRAAENLREAAAHLGQRAKILAVTLDFALEDRSPDPTAYRDGMLAVMQAISDGLWTLGFDRPTFVQRLESGLPDLAPQAALEGQWELSWNHGDHRLLTSAPAYMFARDAYDRPTEAARIQQAEMTAHSLAGGTQWRCPIPHLAESEGQILRVTCQADGPLQIDPDAFGCGPGAGFTLTGTDARITGVAIASDDPQIVELTLSAPPEPGARLAYACAEVLSGGLRDNWRAESATGAILHRWALPAHLPITGGRDV